MGRRYLWGIVCAAALAGCAGQPVPASAPPVAVAPDLTNQFLLSHLDDSAIADPVLSEVVRLLRGDDFFRLTFVRASCGDAGAQYWAGFDNQYNIGIEGDLVAAHMWYALAARQGHAPAGRALRVLAGTLTGAEISEAEQRVATWQPLTCTG